MRGGLRRFQFAGHHAPERLADSLQGISPAFLGDLGLKEGRGFVPTPGVVAFVNQ